MVRERVNLRNIPIKIYILGWIILICKNQININSIDSIDSFYMSITFKNESGGWGVKHFCDFYILKFVSKENKCWLSTCTINLFMFGLEKQHYFHFIYFNVLNN